MVSEIVTSVLSDNTNRRITIQEAVQIEEAGKKKEPKKRERKPAAAKEKKPKVASNTGVSSVQPPVVSIDVPSTPAVTPGNVANNDSLIGQPCPLCGKGTIIKGKTAYGCSEWKNGCGYRVVIKE